MPCSIRSTSVLMSCAGGSAHSDRLASSGQIAVDRGARVAQHPAGPVGDPPRVGPALAVEHHEQRARARPGRVPVQAAGP